MKFRFCGDLDCPDWVLAEIATLSKLTSVRIKLLVNQIVGFCLNGAINYEKIMKLNNNDFQGFSDIKGAVAAVHYIISNSARFDLDEQSLVQEIQQLGLPKENSEALGRQYRENKDKLRDSCASQSLRVNKLTSMDYRIDQVLCTSTGEGSGPLVQLKFAQNRRPQDQNDDKSTTEFACELSVDKFDLLLNELTEAVGILENLTN